ncbi:MAG: site-2 protease family protein [Anaerohalosphaeraceae bacterium]
MMFLAGFGWGKPVPVNLYNYKHPKLYYLLSSLAGPASNILLCGLALAGLYGLAWFGKLETDIPENTHRYIIYYGWLVLTSILYINAILAVFNLIPIPPLDGSKIWPCLIPGMRPVWTGKATWVWFILLVVMMKGDITSKVVIDPAITYISTLMPGSYSSDEPHGENEKLPEGFPAEMEAPEGAEYVKYSGTKNDNGEYHSFYTYFWLEEPNSIDGFKEGLIESLTKRGWIIAKLSPGQELDAWEKEPFRDQDDSEVILSVSWSRQWLRKNNTLMTTISYYTDPNESESVDYCEVEYKYRIEK